MRWASLIPLVGGQVIGTREATGVDPTHLLSYTPFQGNDSFCSAYMPQVPYVLMDKDPRATFRGMFDMVTSTCPCAGLSTFSSAKTGSATREARNKWMKDTCEYVLGEIRPQVYFGENAPGLFTEMGRSVSDFMIDAAKRHGYGVSFYKTSTFYHGIPQRRPRTFYFFWAGGKAPVQPWFRSGHPPAREYLKEMDGGARGKRPKTGRPSRRADTAVEDFAGKLVDDSGYQYLKKKYGDRWRTAGGESGDFFDVLDVMMKTQSLRDFVYNSGLPEDNTWKTAKRRIEKIDGNVFVSVPTLPRLGETYPSVIAKYADRFVHPTEDRFLTYREVAWLMGIPPDFKLPPVKSFNVVCQNVPVATARDMTLAPIAFINGKADLTDEAVMWYDNSTQRTYAGADKRELGSGRLAAVDNSGAEEVFG